MIASIPPAEEWRVIDGWPYEISSTGKVRRIGGLVLKPQRSGSGYVCVWLHHAGSKRREYIHRLVAKAFLGAPPVPDAHADHINGVRNENGLENIRWLSPQENRATRRFAKGEAHGRAKLTIDQVQYIKNPGTTLSNLALADAFGVSSKQIRDIRNGNRWRHV